MNENELISFTQELIARPSVTPEDSECQALIAERLGKLGFTCEQMIFDDVTNLWARLGTEEPCFVFAGHTDVVPTGDLEDWTRPPFEPQVDNAHLYGRGAADMKGSLAAMVAATQRFLSDCAEFKGSIGFLLTSDEEGPAINGTVKVMEALQNRGESFKWCLVGEPSSSELLGDCVRVGRRGSLNFDLDVLGTQGHVAYPDKADNPVPKIAPFLQLMSEEVWDQGNEFFPATTFQISNVSAGNGATNVIPGKVNILGNFRFSTESSAETLQERTEQILQKSAFDYEIKWNLSGNPFLTGKGDLVEAVHSTIKDLCGIETDLSTGGGTSDGRFIAPYGIEVVELGPINKTIHQIDECVSVSDLALLSDCYLGILRKLLLK